MKYDFFKDINEKHGLSCVPIYEKLFKGVKFIPNTYYIVDKPDKDKSHATIACTVQTSCNVIFKIFFRVHKQYYNDYVIHDMYFTYNNSYFYISNIHIENMNVHYNYELYLDESYYEVCKKNNTLIPEPEDFKKLHISSNFSEESYMTDNNSKNIIDNIISRKSIFGKDPYPKKERKRK